MNAISNIWVCVLPFLSHSVRICDHHIRGFKEGSFEPPVHFLLESRQICVAWIAVQRVPEIGNPLLLAPTNELERREVCPERRICGKDRDFAVWIRPER